MVVEAKASLGLDGGPFINTLKKLGKEAEEGLGKKFVALGKKIAAAFAVREIVNFANNALRLADEIDNLASQTDLSYQSVQALKVAAEDAGISFDTLRPTISALRRSVDEARTGNEQIVQSFGTLGLSVEDLREKNTEQIFEAVTQAMASASAGAQTFKESTRVLGAESTRLRELLISLGEEGLGSLESRLISSGRILQNDTIETLDKAEQAVTQFTDSLRNNGIIIIGSILDVVQNIGNLESAKLTGLKSEMDALNDLASASKEEFSLLLDAVASLQGELEREIQKTAAAQEKYNSEVFKSLSPAEQLAQLKADQAETEQEISRLISERSQAAQAEKDFAESVAEAAKRKKEIDDELDGLLVERLALTRQIQEVNQVITDTEEGFFAVTEKVSENRRRDQELQEQVLEINLKRARLEQERDRLSARLAANEADLLNVQIDGQQAATETLDLRTRLLAIVNKIRDIEGDVTESVTVQATQMKSISQEIEEQLQARNRLRDGLQSQIDWLEEMLGFERENNGETQRAIDLAQMLRQRKEELANLSDKEEQQQEKIAATINDQLDAVERLKETFKVMTEDELETLITQLENIARRLAELPEVSNLDWLDALNNLSLRGLNETRARNVRDFLVTLVEGIEDLGAVDPDAMNFLESLSELSFSGMNETRGRNVADFFAAIVEGINQADTTRLANVVGLLQALDDLSIAGTDTNISISLPNDFQGIPLVFSPEADSTLQSIDGSLQTLAQLRGVVWA